MKKAYQITEAGRKELESELEELKSRRGEIADKIGIADSSFSRKLRRELPQDEKQRIFSAIEEIAKEKAVD